jgi:hypothetical protein
MTKRIILLLASLALASCASLPAGRGKEPAVIVIRNRSGADIAAVTLREAGRGSGESRFGTIAPVPQGASQEVGRPTDPPPLPGNVAVEWVDHQGRTVVRELSLRQALKGSAGGRNEAIVFEIGPAEEVMVFREPDLK